MVTRLAAAGRAADVAMRSEIWSGMPHAWPFFHPVLGAGRRTIAIAGPLVRQAMAR